MRTSIFTLAAVTLGVTSAGLLSSARGAEPDGRYPLFKYLTGAPQATVIAYTPAELDPRNEANQGRLATSSIRRDLLALRPAFDGLILYGYHEACTPRIVSVARELKYRAVLLGVWNPKSAAELDGVAELARLYENDFALGVLVGNEGLTFNRYEEEDLAVAADRLRRKLPRSVPLSTTEPLVGYRREVVLRFGEFLAPNIHPVFDRKELAAGPAAAWAREQAAELARKTGKPVLVKETGFPHGGQPGYTPATQREFWQAYAKEGLLARPGADTAWVFHGVGFEAFDLPWKSEESRLAIEKAWGLLSPQRAPHPAFEVWRALRQAADR